MLHTFMLKLLVEAVKNPDIRAFLFEVVDRLGQLLVPKLAAIIPAAVGAGLKGLGDLIDGIDLPGLPEITESIRGTVNDMLPEDIDIPILSDALQRATGFDLTDFLGGKH